MTCGNVILKKNKSDREIHFRHRPFYGQQNRHIGQAIRSVVPLRFRTINKTKKCEVRTEENITDVAQSIEGEAEMAIVFVLNLLVYVVRIGRKFNLRILT